MMIVVLEVGRRKIIMQSVNRKDMPFGIAFEESLPAQRACGYHASRQDHGLTLDDMRSIGSDLALMGTGTGTNRDRDG